MRHEVWVDAGLVRVRADGQLEPNVAEISRRVAAVNDAMAEFGRALLEVLAPALAEFGRITREPSMERLLGKARRRERYNRRMSDRARGLR